MDAGEHETREAAFAQVALRNRAAFEATLAEYVAQKLAYPLKRLAQGERELWFDATDCIWCVFDDPAFERHDDVAAQLREAAGNDAAASGAGAPSLQVFWSMGDVVMPPQCDATWVARQIAGEAARQLTVQGYRCSLQEREVDGETHVGVAVRRAGLIRRILGSVG